MTSVNITQISNLVEVTENGATAVVQVPVTTVVTAALGGNASTATTLQTARTIWGQSFNGSANVTGALTDVTTIAASGNITMSGTGTIKVPVGTTAQRPTAVQGMIRYNTSRGCFEGYTGSDWVNMSPLTLDDVGAT